jgi:4-amino-4-deoxy-L-arabinose transferase-like glycosyltransferase
MGRAGQLRWGVPLGALLVLVASWGLMDFVGSFDDPDDRVARSITLRALAPALASFASTGVLFCLALGGAQAGWVLPQTAWGVVVTLAFVANVAALYDVGRKLGAWGADDGGVDLPLGKRHGFWLVVAAAVLYFPFLGSYSLWDPWETHYGEVAREMLARDDWISLWWAQDGWFFSKPVLDMWMQAIAMATLGVHYQPDKVLVGDGTTPVMHPEWAMRAPVVLLTVLAMYLLYKGASKHFGRRAAFLGLLVLATVPDWYFLAHQSMTDMPFVGAMTACMGLVLVGLRTPEDAQVRVHEITVGPHKLRLSAWHLVFGAVLACALPQILYLLSRNLEFLWQPGAHGFRPHWDEFRSGSGGGNCGLPGNQDCHTTLPATIPRSAGATPETVLGTTWRAVGAFEPALQALLWAALLGLLLRLNWGERRARRLAYLGAWLFAAIATLGKGPAGFGLPVLITLGYLALSRPGEDMLARLQRVLRELAQFEIAGGLLLIVPVVALPWFVAMYVRHGPPFTDELVFHDMFNRAFHHVHDTNEGDDTSFRFYVWQLGYALFPWTGLAPTGLLWWLGGRASRENGEHGDASALFCVWFVVAFALFSFMGTKFHHYIFPAVPPIAMLIGAVLDERLGRGKPALPAKAAPREDEETSHAARMFAAAAVAGGLLLVLVTRDLSSGAEGSGQPGAIRLLQLFTYNYRRLWPDSLDFSATLLGFGAAAVALSFALAVRAMRNRAIVATCGLALVWALWGLDVYMPKAAPHWGQREVIAAYYANRASPDEMLVAYQMNWKGENFYTGNRIPAFQTTGQTFTSWMKKKREEGARVMYFLAEHGRVGNLKSEVAAKSYRELTDKTLCNKFVLVRADL